jgi:hypothetical protein
MFTNGLSLVIAKPTARETATKVEGIMWEHMARIKQVNVVAGGEETAEGARMRHFFTQIEFDLRINTSMDRIGPQAFDLYEIAKYPRRREPC